MNGPQMTDHGVLPSYQGDNLVNLMAELERRLTGGSPTRGGKRSDLAGCSIPEQTQLCCCWW